MECQTEAANTVLRTINVSKKLNRISDFNLPLIERCTPHKFIPLIKEEDVFRRRNKSIVAKNLDTKIYTFLNSIENPNQSILERL